MIHKHNKELTMRTLSTVAITSLVIFAGIYFFLMFKENGKLTSANSRHKDDAALLEEKFSKEGTLLSVKRKRDLDQIGNVINENTVNLDSSTRDEIKKAKVTYDAKEDLKELQKLLEQSYSDTNSSIADIKRIQSSIFEKKTKLKDPLANTEKWNPLFVYYLMIQENYTYAEINSIKSLAENGLNMEEIEYINELIKEEDFMKKVMSFKSREENSRSTASLQKKKETDDFIEDVNDLPNNMEEKLIEMNYNQEEKEEMVYGQNQ